MAEKDKVDHASGFEDELEAVGDQTGNLESAPSEEAPGASSPPTASTSDSTSDSIGDDFSDGELNEFFDDLKDVESTPTVGSDVDPSDKISLETSIKTARRSKTNVLGGVVKFLTLLNPFKWFKSKKPRRTKAKPRKLLKPLGYLVIFLLIVGGIYYFYTNNPFKDTEFTLPDLNFNVLSSFTEPEIEIIEPDINNIVLEDSLTNQFDNFKRDENGSWIIQIATCIEGSRCLAPYQSRLENRAVPAVFFNHSTRQINARFIKLYSSYYFQYQSEAEDMVKKINYNSKIGLSSFVEKTPSGFRLVVGNFPLSTYGISSLIDSIQTEIAAIYPDLLLDISYETAAKNSSQLTLGPFVTRENAQQFLDILQTKSGFAQAIVIRK